LIYTSVSKLATVTYFGIILKIIIDDRIAAAVCLIGHKAVGAFLGCDLYVPVL
jgi:hypothetical protein